MKILIPLLLALLFFQSANSQSLKSPSEFLGYQLGDKFTAHHKMVDYFEYLSAQKNNITLETYGETYEDRPLIMATISAKENMDNIDEIRSNNLKLTGLEDGTPTNNKKAIVWLSYNVHGNESVSMEAAMQTLYELSDETNLNTQKWLQNTVVIIDPCINPDGRDRYANFYRQYKNAIPNPDINSKEHHETWPGGRANHYLFDLNRDWAWVKQKESKARLEKYHEWMPHVHVDFHEQGINSPYYFAPAAEPFHKMITPWQREFQTTIGKNNASYFDKEGWLYFTKEVFDLLYPSYGDTYPTFNGAIGMTYEQGGSGAAGLTVNTEMGDQLTLKDRIAHHHSNGLSTIEATSLNADRVIQEFSTYFGKTSDAVYKSFIIKGTNNQDKIKALTTLMDKHRIKYSKASATSKNINAYDYSSKENKSISVSASDLLISVDQPKSNLVTVFFEPETVMSDSVTYDITAWSLPYVFGLEAYASKVSIKGSGDYSFSSIEIPIVNAKPYAYVSKWGSFEDAKFLAALQKEGVTVRASMYPFSIVGKEFPRGSLIMTRRNNEAIDLGPIVIRLAKKFNREISAVKSGFVDSGYDFGSGNVSYVKAPKIAILSGSQTSSLSFGEIWYYFEQELNYQVTVLDTDYFENVNLSSYNVLIVPNGYYSLFNESKLKELNEWISEGGKIIAIGNALGSFRDKEGWSLKQYVDKEEKEEMKVDDKEYLKTYDQRDRKGISDAIYGAVYKVRLDNTHPLAFGYDTEYFSLKADNDRYAFLKSGWNVGVIENPKPFSGFSGYKANQQIENSLVFGVENKGKGSIVYLADNPLFRSFWENGKLLFANAVFFVGM